jgi:hypothetical protein
MSSETATVASRMLFPFPTRSRARFLYCTVLTAHIKYLEMTQQQLQTGLQLAENETARFRQCVAYRASILILY